MKQEIEGGPMVKYRLQKILRVLIVAVIAIPLFGFVVEQLWNRLVPPIFGWKSITFVQALGLFVLSKILFGGFHRHNRGRRWDRGMMDRWAAMSPEDRDRFRAGVRSRAWCRDARAMQPAQEETAR